MEYYLWIFMGEKPTLRYKGPSYDKLVELANFWDERVTVAAYALKDRRLVRKYA